jgi:hypothetical protein
MNTALSIARCCFLVAATAAVLVLAWDGHQLLLTAQSNAVRSDALLAKLQNDEAEMYPAIHSAINSAMVTADTVQLIAIDAQPHIAQILADSGSAVSQAALFASEQRAQLQKTGADSDATVKASRIVIDRAGLFFKHADEQMNTAPTAVLPMASLALGSLNTQLADPHIAGVALHLDDTSLSLAQTAASGAHVARFYEQKLTKAKGIAKTAGSGAWQVFIALLTGHW